MGNNDVLIIADPVDLHGRAVAREIELLGGRAIFFNTAEFPSQWTVAFKASQVYQDAELAHPQVGQLLMSEVVGIWWRRPEPFGVGENIEHPSYQAFARRECEQTLNGALTACGRNVINQPHLDRMASQKLFQLSVARDSGLRIPKTIVTNDPIKARDFVSELNGKCVYKVLTGAAFGFFGTRLVDEIALEGLWRVSSCPTLFQEHIEGECDIRATIVGNAVFAAKILHLEGGHPIDCRVGQPPVLPCFLPRGLELALIKMTRTLGLEYSAIDLRQGPEGFTFFELNPGGQYLWTEIEAGLPISSALARALMVRDKR